MSIGQTPSGIRIVKETLKASEIAIPLYQVVAAAGEHSNQITVEYNNFAKGRNKPQIFCADQQAVFVQLVSPARFGATHVHSQRLIPMATIALQKWLGAILFLDPNPVAMRGYSYRSELRMQGDGANVSAVLHDLCETQGRTSTGFNGAAALRGGRRAGWKLHYFNALGNGFREVACTRLAETIRTSRYCQLALNFSFVFKELHEPRAVPGFCDAPRRSSFDSSYSTAHGHVQ